MENIFLIVAIVLSVIVTIMRVCDALLNGNDDMPFTLSLQLSNPWLRRSARILMICSVVSLYIALVLGLDGTVSAYIIAIPVVFILIHVLYFAELIIASILQICFDYLLSFFKWMIE